MASEWEYISKMKTEDLEQTLRMETLGRNQYDMGTLFHVCYELAKREPQRGTAREIFIEFSSHYAGLMELEWENRINAPRKSIYIPGFLDK